MNKKIIVIGILILIGLLYFVIPKYNLNQQKEGYKIGYDQAIINVLQKASTCQEVTLRYKNYTLNLFAIECLQNKN